jgi:hypothetical protein
MQPLSMADLQGQLNQVATQADQKQKLEAYKQLLHALMAAPSITSFNAFIDHSKPLCALHKARLDAADPPAPPDPLQWFLTRSRSSSAAKSYSCSPRSSARHRRTSTNP